MAFIIGKIKCHFCGKNNGVLHSVHAYGIYEDEVRKRTFYHPECLELIEIYPENFDHKLLDMAIYINDLRKENIEKCNGKIIKDFKEKVEKLRQNHFERMIPQEK